MTDTLIERLRRALHPAGHEIHFDPEPHAYLFGDETLTSVTTLIKKYFPQFDAPAVAARKAAREGVTVEELLAKWDRRRDEASTFGSKVHQMAELIIQAGVDLGAADHLAVTEREKTYLTTLKAALTRIGKFYDFVDCEKIIFSPGRKIAGTIDLLLRNKSTGAYVIADWKTNREIRQAAYRDEVGHDICRTLPNCNFIHYSLQLCAYRELLVSEGYVADPCEVGSILIHLKTTPGGVGCEFLRPRELHREARDLIHAHRAPSAPSPRPGEFAADEGREI